MAEATGEDAIREAVANGGPPRKREDDADLNLRASRFPLNDYGNAQRLIARFGRDLLFVHGRGWLYWDGRRWKADRGGRHAQLFAHKTALAIKQELDAVCKEGQEAFDTDKAY